MQDGFISATRIPYFENSFWIYLFDSIVTVDVNHCQPEQATIFGKGVGGDGLRPRSPDMGTSINSPHNPASRFQPLFTALISFSARYVILE
jgi:hypothetical protein